MNYMQSAAAMSYRVDPAGKDLLSTPRDVKLAYNVFLGREPESHQVVVAATKQPISAIIRDMLASREFDELMSRLLRAAPGAADINPAVSMDEMIQWLATQFVMDDLLHDTLRACSSWREQLYTLLNVDLLARSVAALHCKPISEFPHPDAARFPAGAPTLQSSPVPDDDVRLPVAEVRRRIQDGRLFDARWYSNKYKKQFASPEEALEDYLAAGAMAGRDPNPLFSSSFYGKNYLLDRKSDEPAFFHYLRLGADQRLAPNALVAPAWVEAQLARAGDKDGMLSALLHKCAALLLDPHPCFSVRFYLRRYPELAARRVHPVAHYLLTGWREKRVPHPLFWPEWFCTNAGLATLDRDPLQAYLSDPALFAAAPNPCFDVAHYRAALPGLSQTNVNPLLHYLEHADVAPASPNPALDMPWARRNFRVQLATLRTDPLSFLLSHGNGFLHGNAAGTPLTCPPADAAGSLAQMQAKIFGGAAAVARRRRVVYLSHNLKMQGAQTSLFELARGMARDPANEVIVLAPDHGPMKDRYRVAGIPVVKFVLPVGGLSDDAQYDRLFKAFEQQIADLAPDIVHGNTTQAYHAIAAASGRGIPTVWNIRESEEPKSHFLALQGKAQAVMQTAIQSPTEFVFVSATTRKLWQDSFADLRASTVNNGIDYQNLQPNSRQFARPTARAAMGIAAGEVLLFHLGTWTERKGQQDLVAALAAMDRRLWPRLKIVMIGSNGSDYSRTVTREIEKLPRALRDRLSVLGETSSPAGRAAVLSAFYAADVFVFTSRIESYPRVINEALYFGLPIVSTPCFGVVEQIEAGVTGLFYDAGDTAKLARCLEHLSLNPQDRLRMGQMARHSARHGVMQYDEMVRRYAAIYDRVAA